MASIPKTGLCRRTSRTSAKGPSGLQPAGSLCTLPADLDAAAIPEKKIAGAAIDVFDPEPPPADYPLLGFDDVLLTPHMAARTHTAVENMSWVARDVVDVLNGRPATCSAP